ncbi:BnaC05g13020D [Brassica napus]|uniref:BnaC05g13020D protein n=1 Tax=Brassica napus TaxID=3708 RepID=A0A078HTH6_BRANA|nr:BnaC05g13020D [Brassica napus]
MLGTNYCSDWETILQLLVDRHQDKIQLFLLRYTFQLAVYSVWRERNGRRHGEKPQTVENICCYIDKGVRNRISTILKLEGKGYEGAMVRWFASR